MRRWLAILMVGISTTAGAFGHGVSCVALDRAQLRELRRLGYHVPRRWVALTFCGSLTYDRTDLVWVETAFASDRRGRVRCVSTAVLEQDRLTLRRLEEDGCRVYGPAL
jgi:hypothetical protein